MRRPSLRGKTTKKKLREERKFAPAGGEEGDELRSQGGAAENLASEEASRKNAIGGKGGKPSPRRTGVEKGGPEGKNFS